MDAIHLPTPKCFIIQWHGLGLPNWEAGILPLNYPRTCDMLPAALRTGSIYHIWAGIDRGGRRKNEPRFHLNSCRREPG
jgi:hypothetical protein